MFSLPQIFALTVSCHLRRAWQATTNKPDRQFDRTKSK